MDLPNGSQLESNSNEEIANLLQKQNQILLLILKEVKKSNQQNQTDDVPLVEVADINMSIGSMIGFIFKWIIASIPVALVIGLFYLIIFVVILGSSVHLFH